MTRRPGQLRERSAACVRFMERHARTLFAIALAIYGVFLVSQFAMVAGGSDSSGYLNAARLLSEGRFTETLRTTPETLGQPWIHTTPLGFTGSRDGSTITPTYPIGVALHFAIAAKIAGWYWGPLLASVLLALGSVWLCHLIAIELGLSRNAGILSAASLAASPMFIFTSVQVLSDTPATAWCAMSVYAALRGRRSRAWAIACGLAFTIAVFTRATNAVLLPALLIALWNWRGILLTLVAGLPGAIALGAFQNHYYGSPFVSGYGAIHAEFALEYFATGMAYFGYWLVRLMPITALAVALGWWLPWRQKGREIAVLVVWTTTFLCFYALYPLSQAVWWCLRFILPAFPAMLLLGAWALDATLDRPAFRERRLVRALTATIALAVIAGFGNHWTTRLNALLAKAHSLPYVEACEWTRTHLPADSIVVCMQASGAFYFYTDFPILRWDGFPAATFEQYAAALHASGRPVYAVLFPVESKDADAFKNLPGAWEKTDEVSTIEIWRLKPAE